MGSSVQTIQGQLIQQPGGGTYLIQGGTMDGEGTPLTHTTRASPATVREVYQHFQNSECFQFCGISVECFVFVTYLQKCSSLSSFTCRLKTTKKKSKFKESARKDEGEMLTCDCKQTLDICGIDAYIFSTVFYSK